MVFGAIFCRQPFRLPATPNAYSHVCFGCPVLRDTEIVCCVRYTSKGQRILSGLRVCVGWRRRVCATLRPASRQVLVLSYHQSTSYNCHAAFCCGGPTAVRHASSGTLSCHGLTSAMSLSRCYWPIHLSRHETEPTQT